MNSLVSFCNSLKTASILSYLTGQRRSRDSGSDDQDGQPGANKKPRVQQDEEETDDDSAMGDRRDIIINQEEPVAAAGLNNGINNGAAMAMDNTYVDPAAAAAAEAAAEGPTNGVNNGAAVMAMNNPMDDAARVEAAAAAGPNNGVNNGAAIMAVDNGPRCADFRISEIMHPGTPLPMWVPDSIQIYVDGNGLTYFRCVFCNSKYILTNLRSAFNKCGDFTRHFSGTGYSLGQNGKTKCHISVCEHIPHRYRAELIARQNQLKGKIKFRGLDQGLEALGFYEHQVGPTGTTRVLYDPNRAHQV